MASKEIISEEMVSKSLPVTEPADFLEKEPSRVLFYLSKAAVGAEFFFTALFSMEIVVKEIALFGNVGFFLGISYAVIQTYMSCFNYYFDCFYKDKTLTDIQKKIFTIITIIFGLFCSVSWFISSMAYGLILYNFDFLHYSHANYLVFAFSLLAASVTTIGTISHITYNLSKIKSKGKRTVESESLESESLESESLESEESKLSEEKKPTNTFIINFFITTQKVGWFFRVINFSFLLSVSFYWYGFILGACLTMIDIYDNSVFLSSCDFREKYTFEHKEEFYAFAIRYLFASGFTICYTSYVVYLNLTYFASRYLTTPCWLNISYSAVTAACGAFAGFMYRCKVFQKIKAKKSIADSKVKESDKLSYSLLARYIIPLGRCSLWRSSEPERSTQNSSKAAELQTS